MMSVDSENKQSLRMQSWILAVRLAVVSLGITLIPNAQVPLATALGFCLAATVVTLLIIRRNCWLPYCYLGAAALWAGYGAGLVIDGNNGPAILFIACLIVVDAAAFISSWGRRWL
jgi:hypothetical protein